MIYKLNLMFSIRKHISPHNNHKGVFMFQQKDLSCVIKDDYFNIIAINAYCITVQSKNTKHYWHIEHEEFPSFQHCIIYHNHWKNMQYHKHGHSGSLDKAILKIKEHDKFQLAGRISS